MKKYIISLGFLLSIQVVFAQSIPCFTTEMHQHEMSKNELFAQGHEQFKNAVWLNQNPETESLNTYIIPVVVHVVHNGGPENISRAQVLDAIARLNEDFRRLNPDTGNTRAIWNGIAADMNIEFRLATKDPNGECTDGIVRVMSGLTNQAGDNVKDLSNWDRTKYMNIWVVGSIENFTGGQGTILGYAYYPNQWASYQNDGILIRHDCMGRIGTATGSFGIQYQGRTLTHEVGHYLGLPHTFEDGCQDGDYCQDTPPTANPNYGCPLGINTCSNDVPDMPCQVENYMDYANGICANMFTNDQRTVMQNSLLVFNLRGSLITVANLATTGVTNPSGPCAPIADMGTLQKRTICAGDSITFYDASWNGVPNTWSWAFAGGTPAVSSDSASTVVFGQAGMYQVSLTVSNAAGTDSKATNNYIVVATDTGMVPGFYVENFEDTAKVRQEWVRLTNNPTSNWKVNLTVGLSGSNSMWVNNYSKPAGETEDLLAPVYDMTGNGISTFSFRYAYAPRTVDDTDQLRVLVSKDCGNSWLPRKVLKGNDLRTVNGNVNIPFTPQGQAQWKEASFTMSPFANEPWLLVKFEFTSGGGNNIYLDDINIFEPLSLEDLESTIEIYPNPFNSLFNINSSSELESVLVVDVVGRTVFQSQLKDEPMNVTIDGALWPSGMYFCEITTKYGVVRQKLIKH